MAPSGPPHMHADVEPEPPRRHARCSCAVDAAASQAAAREAHQPLDRRQLAGQVHEGRAQVAWVLQGACTGGALQGEACIWWVKWVKAPGPGGSPHSSAAQLRPAARPPSTDILRGAQTVPGPAHPGPLGTNCSGPTHPGLFAQTVPAASRSPT
jgi:hypothetical protein